MNKIIPQRSDPLLAIRTIKSTKARWNTKEAASKCKLCRSLKDNLVQCTCRRSAKTLLPHVSPRNMTPYEMFPNLSETARTIRTDTKCRRPKSIRHTGHYYKVWNLIDFFTKFSPHPVPLVISLARFFSPSSLSSRGSDSRWILFAKCQPFSSPHSVFSFHYILPPILSNSSQIFVPTHPRFPIAQRQRW